MTKQRRPKYTPPESFIAQPRIVRVLHLIQRKRGATVADITAHLGWETPSVRAVISRLAQVGIEVSRTWLNGHLVYRHVDRFTGAKDRTRVTKAQAAKLARQGGFNPRMPR